MKNRDWVRAVVIAAVCSSAAPGQVNIYQSSFELDDGGWVGTHDWERGIPAGLPLDDCESPFYGVPPVAYDGQYVWATSVGSCYSNCACEMTLSHTFDLRGTIHPTLRYHWWKDVNGVFDYTSVHVVPTGAQPDLTNAQQCPTNTVTALLEQCDSDTSSGWAEQIIDLSEFEGQVVDVYFSLRASDSVDHPGWYIDDVRITSDIAPNPGDLQVAILDAPDPVGAVGDPITYTVIVTNADPNPISNVLVTTTLDAATSYTSSTLGGAVGGVHTAFFPSLPGSSVTTFDIVAATTMFGQVTAACSVTGDASDPDSSNNMASAATDVTPVADLAVALADAPDPVNTSGEQITYTATVTNNGPTDAHNVALMVELPPQAAFLLASAGTHDGSPSGGTLTANFPLILSGFSQIVSIRTATGVNGQYIAAATVDGEEGDATIANNSASAATTVDVSSDLTVTLADLFDPVVMTGSPETYSLTIRNNGPTPATGVNWNLSLPPEMTFVASSAGSHDGSAAGGLVSGVIDGLPVGGSFAATVDVSANALTPDAVATASAFSTSPSDPDFSDNSASVSTRVVADTFGLARVILSDEGFPTLATTQAPNIPGRLIETIDRPFASPDGSKWAISLNIDGPTPSDDLIVAWDGVQLVTLLQEGVSTTGSDLVGVIEADLSINDAGEVAFATNTDGPSDRDEVAGKVNLAGQVAVVAREGSPAPATGFFYGSSIDSVQIDNAGNVYLAATTTADSDFDEYVIRTSDGGTGTVLFQEGATTPLGQAGGATFPWDGFGLNDLDVTGDGEHTLLQGDTTAASTVDQILAYDNSVVVQEGVVVHPAFVSPADAISPVTASFLADNGDWYAIGDNDDGEDWVLRNGELLVRGFDEVFPGSVFLWSGFTSITADRRGNYVITGFIDDLDTMRDAVLALNGRRLVAREGDPVDVDGDGLYDDDTLISAFGTDDAILTADGQLIVQVSTRGSDGVSTGELLVAFDLGLGCPCEMDAAPGVNVFDLLAYLDAWFADAPAADLNGSGGVDVFDLLAFLDCWFPASAGATCP